MLLSKVYRLHCFLSSANKPLSIFNKSFNVILHLSLIRSRIANNECLTEINNFEQATCDVMSSLSVCQNIINAIKLISLQAFIKINPQNHISLKPINQIIENLVFIAAKACSFASFLFKNNLVINSQASKKSLCLAGASLYIFGSFISSINTTISLTKILNEPNSINTMKTKAEQIKRFLLDLFLNFSYIISMPFEYSLVIAPQSLLIIGSIMCIIAAILNIFLIIN